MNRATATAAPSELRIKDRTYLQTPLKNKDWGRYERWLQDRQFNVARRNMDGLPAELQAELIKHAHDRAAAIGFASPDSLRSARSLEGMCYLIYLSLLCEHPELSEDDVVELLYDPIILSAAVDNLNLGLPDNIGEPAKKKRTGTRDAARKKRKQKRVAKR